VGPRAGEAGANGGGVLSFSVWDLGFLETRSRPIYGKRLVKSFKKKKMIISR